MALKFLNKKGWHTGSLRNIENVWKAEQKHEAEQRKVEELRKQIHDERERDAFRQLQEQAGLVPRQERLDFLYESGLAVGKGSSSGFKDLDAPSAASASASDPPPSSAQASSTKAAVPGALFEEKPQSANDAWRKLHSDPLLLIRQQEQEAIARIKNNPIQMAKIQKSVEAEKKQKQEKKERKKKKHKRKHHHRVVSDEDESSLEYRHDQEGTTEDESRRKRDRLTSKHHAKDLSEDEGRKRRVHLSADHHGRKKSSNTSKVHSASEDASEEDRREKRHSTPSEHRQRSKIKHGHSSRNDSDLKDEYRNEQKSKKTDHTAYENNYKHKDVDYSSRSASRNHERNSSRFPTDSRNDRIATEDSNRKDPSVSGKVHLPTSQLVDNSFCKTQKQNSREDYGYNRRRGAPKLSEEERAARLREMQLNAEDHEQQRWKLLKKAADADRQEALSTSSFHGKNFLHDAQKSIYGTEKGGSSTIEESVRRRTFFSQGSTAASESNAFRR